MFAATIMLKTDSDTNEVRAFDKELREIAQTLSLMEATTFSCSVNKKNIIIKFGGTLKLKIKSKPDHFEHGHLERKRFTVTQ